MRSLRFSDVKIEKLLGLPTVTNPNQFYLIETNGTIEFYLSDSNGNLHLLNSGFVEDRNLNKILDYAISTTDKNAVFNEKNASGVVTFYLPCATDGLEFAFSVHEGGIRVSAPCIEEMYVGTAVVATNEIIESTYIGSFIRLRAIEGIWVARYLTGQWDILLIDYIDGGSEADEFTQIIDGGNTASEYTDIVDGGTP